MIPTWLADRLGAPTRRGVTAERCQPAKCLSCRVCTWENRDSEAGQRTNANQPLTHLLDYTERGIAMQATSCSIPDCDKPSRARGLCRMHYWRWSQYGDPLISKKRQKAFCQAEGCDKAAFAQGWCNTHWARIKRTGSPQDPIKPVGCLVEECRGEHLAKGYCIKHYTRLLRHDDPYMVDPNANELQVSTSGYVAIYLPDHPLADATGRLYEHQMVLFDALGDGPRQCKWCGVTVYWQSGYHSPDRLVVDHLDHNKLNNDLFNLVPSCNPCNIARVS
jgi:hypothetical protein